MQNIPLTQRLKDLADQIAQQDPELQKELNDQRASAALKEEAGAVNEIIRTLDDNTNESLDGEEYGMEAVILRVGRPVLVVQNSEAELKFQDAESEIWRVRLQKAKTPLSLSIPAVGRIELENHAGGMEWCGTGWLADTTTVVTNRHVAEIFGRSRGTEFVFRQGADGNPVEADIDLLEEFNRPDEKRMRLVKILHIEPEPGADMAFIQAEPLGSGMPKPILLDTKAVTKDTQVAIIGYPAKDSRMPDLELMEKIFGNVFNKKRLAPGQITNITDARLFHDCSTLGGNSGSAVISLQTGKAVGLHFAGRFMQTNFAVPAALVARKLEELKRPGKKPAVIRSNETTADAGASAPPPPTQPAVHVQAGAPAPAGGGSYTFSVPLQITVSLGAAAAGIQAAAAPPPVPPVTTAAGTGDDDPDDIFTEARVEDYTDRKGYDEDFLGQGFKVPLPKVTGETRKKDVLTYDNNGKKDHVLRYQHFSVVMSRNRRQCIFSAVNINGGKKQKATRTGWQTDPRIPKEAQIIKECYGSAPKYSRGHMTRREDPVWGTRAQALRGNDDSMHVTNAVPQMQSFNAPVWLALEDYALDNAREDKMSISVFTGPVFRSNDPVQYGVKIPKQFWKIIAFIHDETGELTATGYMMSQEEHIPDVEFIFGEFGTAQVSIASIEKAAGLSFGNLSSHDPMNNEAAGDPVRPLTDRRQMRF